MNKSLILECKTWSDCLARLSSGLSEAQGRLSEQELKLALLPVTSLAWYLASVLPDRVQRDHLEVWVLGAELIDGRDDGVWYRYLAPLLGIPDIHYRLIGPGLEVTEGSGVFRGSLADFLKRKEPAPDVAVTYQPGFEENASMLEEGLDVLLRSGTTIIGSSYSEEEFERDRLMAQAYGYRLSHSRDNPYALDPADTGLHWADRMWHFEPQIPAEGHRPDRALIEAVQCLSHMVAHSRMQGIWAQPAPPGSLFTIPDTRGGQREMIHILDNYYLDRTSGTLYGLDEGRLRPTELEVSADDIDRYPGQAAPIDLALWAAGIKKRYLLGG